MSFVAGRHIQANIINAQGLVHTMRRLRGQRGFVTIKVHLEKAYDSLPREFIDDTLVAAGIPEPLRTVIMDCISTPQIQVLWIGEPTEQFVMGRLPHITLLACITQREIGSHYL